MESTKEQLEESFKSLLIYNVELKKKLVENIRDTHKIKNELLELLDDEKFDKFMDIVRVEREDRKNRKGDYLFSEEFLKVIEVGASNRKEEKINYLKEELRYEKEKKYIE